MPRRNSNPENNPNTPRELVETFESASHRDMVAYADAQVERLGAVAQERFKDSAAWTQQQESFDGGTEFLSLVEGLKAHDHEPTGDEKLALLYMDSVIYKNESQAVVDGRKVALRNNLKGHLPQALQEQFIHEASYAISENETFEANIAAGVNKDDSPVNKANIEGMRGIIRDNKGVINDALVAADEIDNPNGREAAQLFFSEVTARVNGSAQLTNEAFTDLRVSLYKDMRRNIRSARAYNRLAVDTPRQNAPFPSRNSAIDPKKLVKDIEDLAAKNNESVKYVYGYEPENAPALDDVEDNNLDDEELSQQLETIATKVRKQTQELQANESQANPDDDDEDTTVIPKPSDVPQRRPVQTSSQTQGTQGAGQGSSGSTAGTSTGSQSSSGQSGAQPGAGNGSGNTNGNTANQSGNTAGEQAGARNEAAEAEKIKAERRKLQQIRVENAAAALQASSLGRSKQFFSAAEADVSAESLHAAFGKEVYELMQFDRPKILDDPSVTQKEKNAFISKYAFDEYHKVTMATVESMGGEKDPKKRKRNARLLRLGGAGLGFVLGGPAGLAIGGAIGLGLSKGLDSEMKNREKLKAAVQRHEAQFAADNYLNTLDREGEPYSEKEAFYAATANLMGTFEHGLVRGRRRNIGKASLQGAAWTAGTIFVAHEAVGALQYMGDQAYHTIAQASWSNAGAPWGSGLNPDFNYTMHEQPASMKAISGLWNVATGNPIVGGTVGAAILAGLGGIKAMQDGPDAKKKKKNNDRARANAA